VGPEIDLLVLSIGHLAELDVDEGSIVRDGDVEVDGAILERHIGTKRDAVPQPQRLAAHENAHRPALGAGKIPAGIKGEALFLGG
jgi:hypothetical protein